MKTWSILLLTVLILGAALPPAGAGEVLGILEIRGLDNLAEAVFDLTKAVGQPVPKEMVSLGLYDALGSMPGMGIEPYGKMRALWLSSDEEAGSVVLLLPVENDGDDYLANLGQSGWVTGDDTRDGLLTLTAPFGAALPWSEVVVAKRGATLIAGGRAGDVRAADALLADLPTILLAEGVAAIEIRPAALVRAFSAQIEEGLGQAFQTVPGQPKETAELGALYIQAYLALARQVESAVMGLGLAEDNLNLHLRVAPMDDSLLDQWLATLKPPAPMASVVNLPGALYASTTHLGDVGMLAEPYFQLMDQVIQLLTAEVAGETLADYMANARTYWKQMKGDLGIALLPPTRQNPLRAAEYLSLKDPAGLRDLTRQMIPAANQMISAMADIEPSAPFQIELVAGEPRDYREVPVDRITYRLAPGDALQGLWPLQGPFELTVELAWLSDAVLVGVGGEDITQMLVDRALDATAQPISSLPPWQAFFPEPESQSVDLSQFALFDTLRAYMALVDSITGEDSATEIPDGPGYLGQLSYLAMDGVMTRVRLRLSDIAAVTAKVQEAQQRGRDAYQERMKEFEAMMEAGAFDFESMEEADFEEWYDADDEAEDAEADDWAEVDDEDAEAGDDEAEADAEEEESWTEDEDFDLDEDFDEGD